MESPIIQRIVISIVIFLAWYGIVKLVAGVNRRQLQRDGKKHQSRGSKPTGQPRLLYFWTPECSQCSFQEREIALAAEKLHQSGMHLEVQRLNAHDDEELAKSLRVLTVPTTVLLNERGLVVAWNPGLIRAGRIVDQYTKTQ